MLGIEARLSRVETVGTKERVNPGKSWKGSWSNPYALLLLKKENKE